MRSLGLLAVICLFFSPGPLWASEAPPKCWLLAQEQRGDFTFKLYLTEANDDILKAEKLHLNYPDGLYEYPLAAEPKTWQRLALTATPRPLHLELWREGLVDIFSQPALIVGYPDLERAVTEQKNYPVKGCDTHSLFLDIVGPKQGVIEGRNLMLTVCPRHEALMSYRVSCSDAKLYAWVAGDPNDEFIRGAGLEDSPSLRHVCDQGLARFSPSEKNASPLPSPVRRLLFDARQDKWRVDKPGEFPRFYFHQITLTLNRLGLSFHTAPPTRVNQKNILESARELKAEIFAQRGKLKPNQPELAFTAYCLMMMGLEREETLAFLSELAEDELARARAEAAALPIAANEKQKAESQPVDVSDESRPEQTAQGEEEVQPGSQPAAEAQPESEPEDPLLSQARHMFQAAAEAIDSFQPLEKNIVYR